ncbi:hypothetical protein AFLA_009620 [Aspergillus flavus NRRL3357]|nr:hypothetical protein AFLA_009620 [Aspergillus flavus NRRL3357]
MNIEPQEWIDYFSLDINRPSTAIKQSMMGPILVLWLHVKTGDTKTTYVAKTFSDYSEDEARAQLRRIPSKQHSVEDVKQNLDPFLNETRALEHLNQHCSPSRRIYFPQYYGVLTDINNSKFPLRYKPRRQAVVLEAIKPDMACRRILATGDASMSNLKEGFSMRLNSLPLGSFEVDWYGSLLTDRLRRVDAFARNPRPLSVIKKHEKRQVEDQIYARAQQMDFRLYLAESFQSNDALLGALFNPPKQTEDLELIILRVTHRPDGYTMPSLASLFPFLEAIRPNDCPSWHIHRAQQLKYEPVWVLYIDQGDRHGNKEVESLSIVSIYGRDLIDVDMLKTGQGCFFLLLLPRSWAIEEPNSKVLAICSQLLIPGKSGTIIKKVEFDQY